jgi:hypothetical protein
MFTIYQLAYFLIKDLEKDLEKYKSKLLIITGDFFLSDPQITKQDKDWLHLQMIQAIQKVVANFYCSYLFAYKVARFNEL